MNLQDFACKMSDLRLERGNPADKYTIGIIEYNCLSTSGFYNADIQKIIQEISKNY